jgi:hypothetical protein
LLSAVCLAALAIAVTASQAAGSVSIGQIAPVTPPVDCAGTDVDEIQPSVSSGNAYVVPALPGVSALMVSSWSTQAATGAGQMLTMKVFRKAAEPATYQVVGHDGPRPLAPATVNTFESNVPVQPGDLLGLNSSRPAMTACGFAVLGENGRMVRIGNLADGESGAFGAASADRRTNISAVVEPSNLFTLGGVTRNKRRGTATLKVEVPNPGTLTLAGKGVTGVVKNPSAPGVVALRIAAMGGKRQRLIQNGTVKVGARVTYFPTNGHAAIQSRKLVLVKR